jgi:hypothetical protein
MSVPGQPWCFEAQGAVRFHWVSGEGRISHERLGRTNDSQLAFWLIHILLPLYFTLEGVYELIHACAVVVSGRTVLFTGPSHAGKSTLTNYFLERGHALVSDDKVATYFDGGSYFAVPSHPNARPYRQFEDLGRRVPAFSSEPHPIDSIYALKAIDPDAAVRIEEVTGHRKFAGLLPSYLFNFPFLKAKRLAYLAQLVTQVPLYRLGVPWDLLKLGEVRRAVLLHEDLRTDR